MDIGTAIILIVVIGIVCFLGGMLANQELCEREAVDKGHARFNEITKKFEWKE